jgi:desulfoferrodoxin-like iron-binding protein
MPNVQNAGEIFKCGVCGNTVKVIEVGGGELVCCTQPMTRVNG